MKIGLMDLEILSNKNFRKFFSLLRGIDKDGTIIASCKLSYSQVVNFLTYVLYTFLLTDC